MSNMKIFSNPEFGEIRTKLVDGEPWFVGKDIAEALGYSDTSDALKKHVYAEDKLTRRFADSGQNREMYIINESGLYSLILSSKLPGAKKFKRWVTGEVLPSLRKTGGYIVGQEDMTDEELLARALEVAHRKIAQRDKRIGDLEAETEVQRQAIADFEPKASYYDTILDSKGALSTSQIAADYGLSAYRLNQILHEAGIQHKVNGQWILYHKYMGKGLTKSKTINIYHSDGRPDTKMQTQWTQKGRLEIHNILTAHGIVANMDQEGA